MKTNVLFNKALYLMVVIAIIGLNVNTAFSQEKKKLVRVIEIDDKGGEHVVKEINLTNNAAKMDSITRNVTKKIQIEQIKLDSLRHLLMMNMPKHLEFPPMPGLPEMPEFDFGFNAPEPTFLGSDFETDFDMFIPDSESNSSKIYYSEKNFDKNANLDKILEDLEKGTFDPQKWNMKEVDKDKLKDFKTNGKGEVIVIGNRSSASPNIRYFSGNPHRKIIRMRRDGAREGQSGHRMIYFNTDSLSDKNTETYTIESSGDSDNDLSQKFTIIAPETYGNKRIRGNHMIIYSSDSLKDSNDKSKMKTFTIKATSDSDEPNCEKVIVVTSDGKNSHVMRKPDSDGKKEKKMIVMVNDNKTTKFSFTNPSDDEMKMLEKSSIAKEDKTKLLSAEALMFLPKEEKDKYTIRFQEKETGKVKVIIADEKGKSIKTEEFDHSNGKTEKEVEIKDLKSGTYFIQAQLNGKTVTTKLEIKID
jgi:hypothetical protein